MPGISGSVRRLSTLAASGAVIAGTLVAVATPAAAATITITPASGALLAASAGTAYANTITAMGGTAPYTFVVTPTGSLPPGLTFTPHTAGTDDIGGVPTQAGTYSFTVKATDSGSSTATNSYTLTVNATNPSAPTIGTATAGPGDGQATVNFTPSSFNGGATVTYIATSSPSGITGSCSASPCTVSGLTDGMSYTFKVTATNGTGNATSNASNAVTPKHPQTITFANPGTESLNTTPTVTASASSGLAVTFTSATTSVCTIAMTGTSTGKLAFLNTGTCTIDANQAGNTTFLAAPTVAQSFTVQKAAPTVTVTSNTTGNVAAYGQLVTFTATLNPLPTGQVQWSVNGTNSGAAVTLGSSSTITFTPSTPLPVGADVVKASYLGDATHGTSSGQVTETVSKASTTTTVQVTSTTVTATVAPVAPGAGTPTGTVSFTINGVAAGTATVGTGGVATLSTTSAGTHSVSATYSGDSNFNSSIGNRTPIGPTVVAHITSQIPKTRFGWHRSPVYVFFSCTPNTAPLVGSCPGTVTLSRNGFGQAVTETVTATDGGSTTVTVRGINIDRVKPRLTVRRHGTRLSCNGIDGLSGIASCRIHRTVHTRGGVRNVNWTAVATDRAGNQTIKHGHFSYLV